MKMKKIYITRNITRQKKIAQNKSKAATKIFNKEKKTHRKRNHPNI